MNTNTTETLYKVAQTLPEALPEGTPPAEVIKYWLETARQIGADRGVEWPVVDSEHTGKSGTSWQIFPNQQIGHAVNNMLCYQARPVKSILGHRPPPAVLDGGWEQPLIVLAGITIASLLIVFHRVRSVEVAE